MYTNSQSTNICVYIIKEFVCRVLCLVQHILNYNVHKLSKYKKLFVYIIKEFVCCVLCLVQHILNYNVHKLSKYKKLFVYIIKEFVCCVRVSYFTYSIIMYTNSQSTKSSLCTL